GLALRMNLNNTLAARNLKFHQGGINLMATFWPIPEHQGLVDLKNPPLAGRLFPQSRLQMTQIAALFRHHDTTGSISIKAMHQLQMPRLRAHLPQSLNQAERHPTPTVNCQSWGLVNH